MVEIKNIKKHYAQLKAVDGVNFKVNSGEIFGLLGPNGAGKSTLISMITTLIMPDSGEIIVDGLNSKNKSTEIKKLLGYVPQDIALYPTLTAKENLTFWGRMYGLSGKILKERVLEGLEIAGLSDRANGKIETFSGGMKRRINIAAALLHKPKLVIMDEPTVGIDPQSRNYILETVLNLNKQGMTVIYTSHYMEEVEYLCENIAIMDNGLVKAYGSKEELKKLVGNTDTIKLSASYKDISIENELKSLDGVSSVSSENEKYTILAKDAGSLLVKVLAIFEKNKCKVGSVSIEESNLESVFLHLTNRALRD